MKSLIHIVLYIALVIPVLRAQDSLNICRLSNELFGWDRVTGVSIQNNIAFLATEDSGLYLLDITNPSHPKVVNTMSFEEGVTQVDAVDNLAYVYDRSGTLSIINILNSPNLTLICDLKYDFPGSSFERIGNCIIGIRRKSSSTGESILTVIDATNPDSLEIRGSITFNGLTSAIALKDSVMFVSTHSVYRGVADNLLILDFTDIDNPEIVDSLIIAENAFDIEVNDDYLYHFSYEGLHIFDVSDAASPGMQVHIDSWNYGEIEIDNNLLYSLSSAGFEVFDLANPLQPLSLNEPISDVGGAWSIDISNGIVVAGRSSEDLVVINASNPEKITEPERMHLWLSQGEIKRSFEKAVLICTRDIGGAWGILDFNNPVNPKSVHFERVYSNSDLDVYWNYVYLVERKQGPDGSGQLSVYSITDTENPVLVRQIKLVDFLKTHQRVCVKVNYPHLYIGLFNRGMVDNNDYAPKLIALDISNPANPEIIGGHYNLEMGYYESFLEFNIMGDFLYATTGISDFGRWCRERVFVYDVSDPKNPNVIFQLDSTSSGEFTRFDPVSRKLYLGDYTGLNIYELTPTSIPDFVHKIEIRGLQDFVVSNNLLHAAVWVDNNSKLEDYYVYDISDPLNPDIVAFYKIGAKNLTFNLEGDNVLIASDYMFGFYELDFVSPDVDPRPRKFDLLAIYPVPFNSRLKLNSKFHSLPIWN